MKIGTVVQLNSGGPNMTVIKFEEPDKATCAWFSYTTFVTEKIPADALTEVKIPKKEEFVVEAR